MEIIYEVKDDGKEKRQSIEFYATLPLPDIKDEDFSHASDATVLTYYTDSIDKVKDIIKSLRTDLSKTYNRHPSTIKFNNIDKPDT